MRKLHALVSLILLCGAAASELGPRGARPVEPSTRSDNCPPQKEWPFCTDDDWGHKCPSGCRIQGLMDKNDHMFLKGIEKIRNMLEQNQAKYRTTDHVSKQTYDYLREKLTLESGWKKILTNKYISFLFSNLRKRINDLKITIDRQLRSLKALKDRVRDQVVDMQRLEVDIDIKLRACKGSCSNYPEYQVDRDSYVDLEKQVNQLHSQAAQSVETVKTLYVMKSRQLQDLTSDSNYKSGVTKTAAQQKVDVKQFQLVLEEEGSKASPATISKDTGTSFFPSSSSTSTTIVVHTKDGPVERTEEVIEGGPQCQALADFTKGGSLPSTFSHTSSSSSSTTKTIHSGGTKGSLTTDSNTGFGDVGFDLGGFMTDDPEDDIPDFHARSVKSTRVERQASYVGKGTETSDVE
uniref:Fibrinogen alpha chain n=1 Tax=Cynoglossus semilaevis TaxID=244447 RepID=A0A3P8V297_CYNSE